MKNKKCSLCGYEMNKPNALKRHIAFHHKDVLKNKKEIEHKFVFDFYGKTDNDIKNIISDYELGISIPDLSLKHSPLTRDLIKSLLDVNNIKRRTISETRKTNYYKNKIKETNLAIYGVINPSQNDEVKKKKIETMMLNFGRVNNFCDSEIKQKAFENVDFKKISETNKKRLFEKFGVENIAQLDYVKEKNSKSKKEFFAKLTLEEKRKFTEIARKSIKHTRVSKLETRVQSILNEIGLEYSANCFIFGYNYDLVFRNKKIIIEIQGDYWHGNPNKYKADDIISVSGKIVRDLWKQDEKKKQVAEKNNYTLIAIWEFDLRKMKDENLKNFLIEKLI